MNYLHYGPPDGPVFAQQGVPDFQPARLTEVGPYRLGEEIAAGFRRRLFHATDARNGAEVVLAIPNDRKPAERRQQLVAGYKPLVERLTHPAQVKVLDANEYEGRFVVAYEFAVGESVALPKPESPWPLERVRAVLAPVAGALDAAHAADLIHGRLRPSEILRHEADGTVRVKLLDIGRAALDEKARVPASDFIDALPYFAPEQVLYGQTRTLRPRPTSDLWALAVIAFRLLTGHHPLGDEHRSEEDWERAIERPDRPAVRPTARTSPSASMSRSRVRWPETRATGSRARSRSSRPFTRTPATARLHRCRHLNRTSNTVWRPGWDRAWW